MILLYHHLCPITNYKIVSQIRCELADKLNIEAIQQILAGHWRGYCENKNSLVCDAICYESYVRYPTDVKLLYETVVWNYEQLKRLNRQIGEKTIRTKMSKWMKRYRAYSKNRRPSKTKRRSITRALLRLLTKINKALQETESQEYNFKLVPNYWQRR